MHGEVYTGDVCDLRTQARIGYIVLDLPPPSWASKRHLPSTIGRHWPLGFPGSPKHSPRNRARIPYGCESRLKSTATGWSRFSTRFCRWCQSKRTRADSVATNPPESPPALHATACRLPSLSAELLHSGINYWILITPVETWAIHRYQTKYPCPQSPTSVGSATESIETQ